MSKLTLHVLMLLVPFILARGADTRLDFQLTVSPQVWTIQHDDNVALPVLILWKVLNKSSDVVILPTDTYAAIELVDANGKRILGGWGKDSASDHPSHEFRVIQPKLSSFVLGGFDLNIFSKNNAIIVRGDATDGSWLELGPLAAGTYKLRCTFSATNDPDLDKGHILGDKIWVGQYVSEWIEIIVKR